MSMQPLGLAAPEHVTGAAGAIAFVIPVFRHSSLFLEAIASLGDACERGRAHVVIVDDGCPNFQTAFSGVAAARRVNVHYIRQINRGLSGARNCGIDFVLNHLPECRAIYFLDADNRLSAFSMSRFEQVLDEAPETDWFYPDIDMFGLPMRVDYSGPFRCISEVLMNICEAGSLVRRRVFEAGCRFDEKMRAGYEDWEFWISLMERGFVGAHLPASGFCYRKRAESMLVESTRRHQEIVEYIETKHPWMRHMPTLVSLEHVEAPRFAIVAMDVMEVRLGTDPHHLRSLSLGAYIDLVRQSIEQPNWASAGSIVIFAGAESLECLKDARLLRYVFWRAELALETCNFVSVELGGREDAAISVSTGGQPNRSDLVFMKIGLLRDILADTSEDWVRDVPEYPEDRGVASISLSAWGLVPPRRQNQLAEMLAFVRRLRLGPKPVLWADRQGMEEGTPDLGLLTGRLRGKMSGAILPCRLPTQRPSVAFTLPLMAFGGVEKVALFVAREFKARGYDVDLIIVGVGRCALPSSFQGACDEIYILDHLSAGWNGPHFEGTPLPTDLSKSHPETRNLLQSYDVVINCHAAALLHDFADLRRAGIITVNYVHLIEYTETGRAVGIPVVGLAFEHGIDLFAACSGQMAEQMSALGVPREKVIEVPNGPGISIPAAAVAQAIAERRERAEGPLRVLYVGRLDPQKGLDRLARVVRDLHRDEESFTIRIVGGRVVDRADDAFDLPVPVEPPVFDDAAIADLYAWADVLVMPSRFEGLPLAIIEAMTLGAVPVVTDVGAVREAVTSGEDGFVISGDDVAEQMIAILRRLAENRSELRRMSQNAAGAAAGRCWRRATEGLFETVEALTAQKRRLRRPAIALKPLMPKQ